MAVINLHSIRSHSRRNRDWAPSFLRRPLFAIDELFQESPGDFGVGSGQVVLFSWGQRIRSTAMLHGQNDLVSPGTDKEFLQRPPLGTREHHSMFAHISPPEAPSEPPRLQSSFNRGSYRGKPFHHALSADSPGPPPDSSARERVLWPHGFVHQTGFERG